MVPSNVIMLMLLWLLMGCGEAEEIDELGDSTLLIRGASIVLPAEGRATSPRDILIADGRIKMVAAAGELSQAAATHLVLAEDLFVLPGFIDVHAHIGDGGIGPQRHDDRENALAQFLRYGVTTIFVPGGGAGNDHQLARWKEQCSSGVLLCPDVYGSGALITAPGSHPIGTLWELPVDADSAEVYQRGALIVTDTSSITSILALKQSLGADALKIIIEDWGGDVPRLPDEHIEALVSRGRAAGLRTVAHVSMPAHVEAGVASGVNGIMHSAEAPIDDAVFEAMADRGVFYVSTLALYDGFFDRAVGDLEEDAFARAGVSMRALNSLADFHFSPFDTPEYRLSVESAIADNLRRAALQGVPLAVGTDTNNPSVYPGYSFHEEMVLMVETGLTPAQVLFAATEGGAAFLDKTKDLGKVEAGYEADLVLLAENPLEDIYRTRHIKMIVHDGLIVEEITSLVDPSDHAVTLPVEPK